MTKPREFEPNYSSALGLKQGHAETNMPFGALLDVLNMNLDGLGGKWPRNGFQERFHLTNGSGGARVHSKIQSLFQFKPTTGGTNKTLAFAGDTIYLNADGDTDTSVLRSGLTSAVTWSFCQYNDFVHGVNGNDTSVLYNGTNYVTISITAPTAHLTLAAVAGGSLASGSSYQYLMTFYDEDRARESAPFTVTTAPSQAVAGADLTVRLSNFPAVTAGQGVTHRRIYRRRNDETLFTLTASVTVGTATYDDTGDATGTTELEIDTGIMDNGYTAHPQSNIVLEAFDRLIMIPTLNPTIAVFSLPGGKYFGFPSANFLVMGRNDGDPIIRAHKHGEAVVFEKRNSAWILDGDPATTVPRRISGVGTQDIRCSASDDNVILRLTPNGFYLTSPTDFSKNDLREEYIGKDVVEEEKLIDWDGTAEANVYPYSGKNSRHIYGMFPNSSTVITKVLVYDTAVGQWVKYQLGTDVYAVAPYESDGQLLTMMGDSYGMVWRWDVGSADGTGLGHELLNGTMTAAAATTFTDTGQLDDSGTATAGGAATLTDGTKAWTVNQHVGAQVYIASGTGSGQFRTVLSNTSTVITTTVAWVTPPDATSVYQIGGWPVDGLIGVLVTTRTGLGGGQMRRISTNTPTQATITAAWTTTPDLSTTYSIGAIDTYGEEFWDNNGDSHTIKRMRWILPYLVPEGDYPVEVSFRRNFRRGVDRTQSRSINLLDSESLWGVFQWGVGQWGASNVDPRRIRLRGKYRYYSVKYRNNRAAQPFKWNGHGAVFQRLYDRSG